ncbi:MAG: DUF1573 domain-containing protein [Planctomycetia bacterium]|nr:DUF1573 domain-containing protein [Planctomycetia bacterium]
MHAVLLSWMIALSATTGSGNWAADMFETTSHNFGTVVKGSKTDYEFTFTNKYNEDVVISSVTSSCQCTFPEFTRTPIKTWEKGKVKITVNTKNFVGNKNATITVRFSKPYPMEVQLHSYVHIRADVAVNPGIVYFGTVSQGKEPALNVNINCVGRPNWRIQDVQSTCPFLSVKLRETSRNYSQVSYQMTVFLKQQAPAGRFSEFLELVTNDPDPRNQRFPIQVEGRVRQPLSVNPSPLSFGLVEIGQTATKVVVVEGQEPFRILDIRSQDPYISANIRKITDSRYTVGMQYTGKTPGTVQGKVIIITDVDGETLMPLDFMGKITEPETHEALPALQKTETAGALPEESEKIIEENLSLPATDEILQTLTEDAPGEKDLREEDIPEEIAIPVLEDVSPEQKEKEAILNTLSEEEFPVKTENILSDQQENTPDSIKNKSLSELPEIETPQQNPLGENIPETESDALDSDLDLLSLEFSPDAESSQGNGNAPSLPLQNLDTAEETAKNEFQDNSDVPTSVFSEDNIPELPLSLPVNPQDNSSATFPETDLEEPEITAEKLLDNTKLSPLKDFPSTEKTSKAPNAIPPVLKASPGRQNTQSALPSTSSQRLLSPETKSALPKSSTVKKESSSIKGRVLLKP